MPGEVLPSAEFEERNAELKTRQLVRAATPHDTLEEAALAECTGRPAISPISKQMSR